MCRRFLLVLLILLPWIAWNQNQKNIELLDHWFTDTLLSNSSQVRYSGCYGFEYMGQEYGVLGTTEGAFFFLITEDDAFQFVDFVPGKYQSSLAITREYKAFDHYVYAAGDEGSSSLQVIDIASLPDSVHVVNDLQGPQFGRIHNLFVDSSAQLLYACMVTPMVSGVPQSMIPLCVYSLQNPALPQLVYSGMQQFYEVHDIYVRQGKAILNCGYEGIAVFDFTNPGNPMYLSGLAFYNYQGYNHQGWLTPDGKTYVFTDETIGLPLKKCEVLPDFSLVPRYFFGAQSAPEYKTAHNVQCNNQFAFVSYYVDGLRIYNIESGKPFEVAFYDTYQEDPNAMFSMWGAWGVFALFNSERILISDRNTGFYLFKFNQDLFQKPDFLSDFMVYPNPTQFGDGAYVRSKDDVISNFTVEIFDVKGNLVLKEQVEQSSIYMLPGRMSQGAYRIRIGYTNYLNESVFISMPWVKI